MALFPNVPFGVIQSGIVINPAVTPIQFKYQIKRTITNRAGIHKFCNFSEQRYVKGIPTVDLDMQWKSIVTTGKEMLRLFYNNARGSTLAWSTVIDGTGYENCRFMGGFEGTEISQGLWDITMRARGVAQGTAIRMRGAGALVIVPATSGTVDVAWNVGWNLATDNATFAQGTVRVAFDGSGGATIEYLAGSGGEDVIEGRYHQKFGIVTGGVVTYLVEPVPWTDPAFTPSDWDGPATVGPVSLGTGFTAGDEIQLAVMTSGSPLGTDPKTVFFSGPAYRNPDGTVHNSIS
jgi:hypothetical protein